MTSPLPNSPATTRPPSRLGRILPRTLKGWAFSVLAVLITLVIIAYLLARSTPAWYVQMDPTDLQVMDLASRVQLQRSLELTNTLEAVPTVPISEHKWSITQDEINSFLAVRFASATGTTTNSAAAPDVSGPIVVFTPGKITLAARTPRAPGGHPNGGVVSVVFSVRTAQAVDGSWAGVINIEGLWLGNLPVPRFLAQDRIRATLPQLIPVIQRALSLQMGAHKGDTVKDEVADTARLIAAGEPFPLEYKVDRRRILIKEILIEDGSLTITFIPPPPNRAPSASAGKP